jgi:gamma-glutamyltranspeptidase / glutathione hydrolase / leukotriene-C4 hydrolase
VTNTINDIFGAFFRSTPTGIIPNDEMDDFSTPGNIQDGVHPSPNNFAIPYNNPISSMVPTIVIDKNDDVRLIVGGAGGRRIITGTFMTLFRNLYFKETLEQAINGSRIHHQLTPVRIDYEASLDSAIVEELAGKYGHVCRELEAIASIVGISVEEGEVKASEDPRRGGSSKVFEGEY